MLSPRLETERLVLRRYEETDIDMQYEVLTDNRLAKYIKFPNLTKEEELECIKDWIKNADDSKYEKWVITLKDDNTPIGNISVNGIEKKHNYALISLFPCYAFWPWLFWKYGEPAETNLYKGWIQSNQGGGTARTVDSIIETEWVRKSLPFDASTALSIMKQSMIFEVALFTEAVS